uniref:Putative reverse transcriptase n=1 Tax=Ixodes ricinus TaxID=34613 RepID=A0A0K8RDD4_IXORI
MTFPVSPGWCSDNLSVVNSDDTKIMTMCRKHKIMSYMYLLGYTSIQRVQRIRDLGVYFDSYLSFSYHVNQIVTSASQLEIILCPTQNFLILCLSLFSFVL